MFPFTRIPCWVPIFDPQPNLEGLTCPAPVEDKRLLRGMHPKCKGNRMTSLSPFCCRLICLKGKPQNQRKKNGRYWATGTVSTSDPSGRLYQSREHFLKGKPHSLGMSPDRSNKSVFFLWQGSWKNGKPTENGWYPLIPWMDEIHFAPPKEPWLKPLLVGIHRGGACLGFLGSIQ